MAKRYSLTAGRVVDVPEPKGPSMDDDMDKRLKALEGGERIKALEDEIAMLRASNRQLMREKAEAEERATKAAADLATAQQAHANAAPAAPPVVNVPAPVVNVPAPVVNINSQAPSEFDVRVTGRDGMGRPVGYKISAVAPLKL